MIFFKLSDAVAINFGALQKVVEGLVEGEYKILNKACLADRNVSGHSVAVEGDRKAFSAFNIALIEKFLHYSKAPLLM